MKFSTIALLAACAPAVVTDAKLRGKNKKNKMADLKEKMPKGSKEKMPTGSPSSSPSQNDEEPPLKRKLYEKTLRIEGLGPDEMLTSAEILYLEDLIKKNLNGDTAENPFQPEGHHSLLMTDVIVNDRRLFDTFHFVDFQDDDDTFGTFHTGFELETQDDDTLGAFDFGNEKFGNGEEDQVYIDVKTWDEYICKYCPDDEDDWVPPPKGTPAPTPAPTYGYKCNYCGPDDDEWRTAQPSVAPTTPAPTINYTEALLKVDMKSLCNGSNDSPFFRLRKISFCYFL
jgi:hypothetical protein